MVIGIVCGVFAVLLGTPSGLCNDECVADSVDVLSTVAALAVRKANILYTILSTEQRLFKNKAFAVCTALSCVWDHAQGIFL